MKISSIQKKTRQQRERRKKRVRRSIRLAEGQYRLTVFRSNKYIYAQIIDDRTQTTLLSFSDQKLSKIKKKSDRASYVGTELAKLAEKKKIKKVVFDRGWYRYHGRIKSLAEAVRKNGLQF